MRDRLETHRWLESVSHGSKRVFGWLNLTRLWKFVWSGGQKKPAENVKKWADDGHSPIVTQQPTVGGNAGEPMDIIVSEVESSEDLEYRMFHGFEHFIRGGKLRDYTVADSVLLKLISELKGKAMQMGADAVVSTTIKSVHGVDDSGKRRIKMSAIGTAVRIRGTKS